MRNLKFVVKNLVSSEKRKIHVHWIVFVFVNITEQKKYSKPEKPCLVKKSLK